MTVLWIGFRCRLS